MGVELIFEAIAAAKAAGRKLTIACTSALTDMAQCLGHPRCERASRLRLRLRPPLPLSFTLTLSRWEKEAPGVVSAVTVMCSAAHGPEGVTLDEEAQNARFDLKAARFVYSTLQAQRAVRFTVVTRHSAAACRLPRNSLNGSLHPVAKRLAASGPPNMQALWQRVHLTPEERKAKKDTLPANRDVAWFRKTFMVPDAPLELGKDESMWPYFLGFNEYDGLTAVVAATVRHGHSRHGHSRHGHSCHGHSHPSTSSKPRASPRLDA